MEGSVAATVGSPAAVPTMQEMLASLMASQQADQARNNAMFASLSGKLDVISQTQDALVLNQEILSQDVKGMDSLIKIMDAALVSQTFAQDGKVEIKHENLAAEVEEPNSPASSAASLADTLAFSSVSEPSISSVQPAVYEPLAIEFLGLEVEQLDAAAVRGGSQRLAAKPAKRWNVAEVGRGTEARARRRRVFNPGRPDDKLVHGGTV